MKNFSFTYLLIFGTAISFAQVRDDFSDGNLTVPLWLGNITSFVVNNSQQLQLNAGAAGTSYLSMQWASPIIDTEWQLFARQSFSPSGNNYGRFYLASSGTDLTQPLNGYYLQFGEAGANDAIQLFRQDGLISTSICRGKSGAIAGAFAVRVKVLRDKNGGWQLWTDYQGGTNFSLDASGFDTTYSETSFLGFLCVYTSSNATKFIYDDVYAGPFVEDASPPVCLSVGVLSSQMLSLTFSEPLDSLMAVQPEHFRVDHNIGNPIGVNIRSDSNILILNFKIPFDNGVPFQIEISGIADKAGNVMPNTVIDFLFFQPYPISYKDIIITEIFPDPLPAIGLPEAEFVELYNRSSNPVQLAGWTLSDGTSKGILSPQILLPKNYLVVTASQNLSGYMPFGKVCSTNIWPSLNNSGDTLVLQNAVGLTMDSVRYDLSYYHDSDKEDGGWTLELIDIDNPCGESENWAASEDPSGGTPCKVNSIKASKPDLIGPGLLSVIPSPKKLVITFSEKLSNDANTTSVFSIEPSIKITSQHFIDKSLKKMLLQADTIMPRTRYHLIVSGVHDCNGNEIIADQASLEFALPEVPDSLDIVLNEILFNPRPLGTDFVEIYNHTPKFINLRHWKVGNLLGGTMKNIVEITAEDFFLLPQQIIALTEDPHLLASQYPAANENHFLKIPLPPLPDDEGTIALMDEHGKVMDAFQYNKSFHSPMLQDVSGVSLERISASDPTQSEQNWKSAASQAGFATPGEINSNARSQHPTQRGNVVVEPEIFMPQSGNLDFAKITYSFEQPGYFANVKVLDQQGRLVRTIGNNELLGYEGFFRWDGDRDDGSRARSGYYIIWFEVFNLEGNVTEFRKRAVVVAR